jgi:hypothetical protein
MPPSHTKWAVLKRWGWLDAHKILNQDAQGRVLISRERRALLLEEYDRSGMSGVKFAQYVGIKYSTLAYWQLRHVASELRVRELQRAILNIP